REGRAERLDGRFPSEIAPLVEDLNAYVADNAAIIARARVQAGNLAHGLRTPLAVITDEAERLAMAPATRASGEALLAQATAMARQIEFQLARARQAGAARHGGQGSLLPDLLAPLLSAMRKLHPDRRFEMAAVPDAPVRLPFDPVDLSELLSILLDNAGKWARSAVSIAIEEGAGGPRVTIADDGPGMTAEQIGLACQIGSRFDPAMPGSGLGLAIAQDIAAGYGWVLRLEQRAGGGLAARLMPRLMPRQGPE
ncbi:MAG TPA: ATP-binding protein, partial [Novosphingobium sp.]|nr:ATP-binding protein [Novosphingobium sp.]